ncbi:hypothetical protein PC129_g14206 [Phytophthora cactorum]|uniref:Uncharacterized protein n=1 Tax=Phytophthora cactorum TaxID=29920 RepID=A0A8T1FYY9_9STRA|nr:hypothetical protein PC111_g14295 [Phytophthora cactorum]KAG2855154.1 hypothetical protein PC113_g12686 [Phytophthora cactorum]KAG2899694.1 hypothetical protein PC114_g13821 [Phytophthora cactorum]KAG2912744.1 hypothetical protein PC115_g12237 [Phytophthora cactorum]KAG2977547.1 hypothetical protein PC118_g12814 [Phytophthora cactorum]
MRRKLFRPRNAQEGEKKNVGEISKRGFQHIAAEYGNAARRPRRHQTVVGVQDTDKDLRGHVSQGSTHNQVPLERGSALRANDTHNTAKQFVGDNVHSGESIKARTVPGISVPA